MEKMPYYAITVRRYNILFRHTEWFHQTQDLYNEILLFYYQLYLETFPDEQPGTQEALRILEKLTIVGRDKQPVPNPIPWKKVPLYFRRAAINTATAAAKSYLAREEQEQPTEAFTESVTFYKGMYRDFQQNTISLKLWDGEGWQWCRLRLRGNTVPEEGQMMSPALVLKKDRAELHIPWKIPVADGRGARERITAESKICSAVFTGQDACTVCCILDSSGKRESSFYIKGGREYANASRQIYDRIKRSEDVQGGGGNAKANYRYWKKLKNLHEHRQHDDNVVGAYAYGMKYDIKSKIMKIRNKEQRSGRSLLAKMVYKYWPEIVCQDRVLFAAANANKMKNKCALIANVQKLRFYSKESTGGLILKILFGFF